MSSDHRLLDEIYALKPAEHGDGTAPQALAAMKAKRAELRARRAGLADDEASRAEIGLIDLALAELSTVMAATLGQFSKGEQFLFAAELAGQYAKTRDRYSELETERNALIVKFQSDMAKVVAEVNELKPRLEPMHEDLDLIVQAFGDDEQIAKLFRGKPVARRA